MAYKDILIDLKAKAGSNLVLESNFNLTNLKRFPLNNTQVCGYAYPPRDSRHKLFTLTGTATPDLTMFQSIVGMDVDPTIWEWVPIIYPHWFPADVSVAAGVANTINAINAWPGKFGMAGYSMGGIVMSNVLWELRHGSMQHRYADLIGAVTFGNPCREAGHTLPGGVDPGGAGIAPNNGLAWGRIQNTPSLWWDFANHSYEDPANGLHAIPNCIAGDPFTVNPTNSYGTDITAIYLYFFGEWDGADYTLNARLQQLFSTQAIAAMQDVIGTLTHIFRGFGVGHMEYGNAKPLPGSDLSSAELAIQHLDTVGHANPLTPQITGDDEGGRAWKWEQAAGIDCGFIMAPTVSDDHYSVTPDEIYMVECRMMPYAGNNVSTGSVQLGATFIDTTGRLDDTEFYEDFPQNGDDVLRGAWNSLETTVTVPAGYNQAKFWVRTTANSVTGNKYWIDNPVVRESTFVSNLIANLASAFTGGEEFHNTKISVAIEAMKRSYLELQNGVTALQVLRASADRLFSKGEMFRVEFDYFSKIDDADFTVTYSGPGNSTIGIKNGVAQWATTSNTDRDAKIIFNSPTATDFQIIRGTMASPPQNGGDSGKPKFSAIGRVSADGNSYVFARAYSNSVFSYRGEMGCVVNGVETVWKSDIPLTWSLDMAFVCGVGTNPRQYQVWSGTKLVYDHTESGTASQLGASYRKWGAIAQIRAASFGGPFDSGKVASCTAADNEAPPVTGSTARMYRTGTGTVNLTGGSSDTALPNSFFSAVSYESPDVDADTTTGTFTVTDEGPYVITGRIRLDGNIAALCRLNLQIYTNSAWSLAQAGDSVYPGSGGAGQSLSGQWIQYLKAGDKVRLSTWCTGITNSNLTGEATGKETYFSIVKHG